ncbi:chemokine XC receptor 1-like [Dicentrarchus labrax]|uniref:chemokine XC receptor 1-like n=1 Tax=Dicentrarchus labrax TaxID=13489 RepID=UPI0021F515F7|nr:chemokine XC receptor 1-like [Dicentrarchus labrax]
MFKSRCHFLKDINKQTMALDSDYNISYDYDYYIDYENDISFVGHHVEIKTGPLLSSFVCFILIFCISVPGNSFLLWGLLRERAWKTTTDILLLQLIISDLCLTLSLPFKAFSLLYGWSFLDKVCGIINGAFVLGVESYILILTAMTLYHYVVVVHASCLSAQTSKKCGVRMASIVIWLVCAAASIEVLVNSTVTHASGYMICMYVPQSFIMLLSVTGLKLGLFFILFIIITFCFVHMWITIKQCRINRHYQASRLILGMTVTFFLSLLPYNLFLFIHYLFAFDVLDFAEWRTAMYYSGFIIPTLPYIHCFLNPLLHLFGAQRFRRHLPVPCNTSSERHVTFSLQWQSLL